MATQKIFFSYSRADGAAFALRLAVDLKKKGFDVWIDQQDIRAGQEWDMEIEKALEACDCLLFVETEKSVVSHNVLDEVYYALDQHKKVIPLICVDSRTPYRLNRLQHIDFTKSYESGLALLVEELGEHAKQSSFSQPEAPVLQTSKKSFPRSYRLLTIAACVLLIAAIVFFLVPKNKNESLAGAQEEVVLKDGSQDNSNELSPAETGADGNASTLPSKEVVGSSGNSASRKKVNSGSGVRHSMIAEPAGGAENSSLFKESVTGDWSLTAIEPKGGSPRGYLKIESSGEQKATIKTYMQFYYPDSKADAYLTVFNAFAGCTSCALDKEMKLKVEDIAVGSRTIKKYSEDQADGKKAGEVMMDANANKSVNGTITLRFVDAEHAVIKVKQPLSITLSPDLMLEPFQYTFHFRKNDE